MLEYRITPLPPVWPGKSTPVYQRTRAPFKTLETRALALLEREIRMLGGKRVEIAVDAEPRYIRQDGQLRADARPKSPAVVVSFDVPEGKLTTRLQFPADQFAHWWSNVDAVARALEALRLVDRYGVQQGRQYSGYRALPSSTAPTQTADVAAGVIASALDLPGARADILRDATVAKRAIVRARAATHPDANGGARAAYDAVDAAAAVLTKHHGGAS
ncbi:hypothetical protein tb265_38830 [Gemmatimonadetes bacterium T265]|nr:hypothetical protein tb265_38830 [Gemmatimonadetes bacterium T265]